MDAKTDIGSASNRVNVDYVEAQDLPRAVGFRTSQVAALTNEILLGAENILLDGQLTEYRASGTVLSGPQQEGWYFVTVGHGGRSVTPSATRGGPAIDIGQAGPLSGSHSLTAVERFNAEADEDIWLDLRSLRRDSGVSYDGKTVEDRRLAEIDRALEALDREIAVAEGRRIVRQVRVTTAKGL